MGKMLFFAILLLLPIAAASDVTTFLSPDNSLTALEGFLRGAEELRIASYTLESPYIVRELLDLDATGANITILLEKSPVGGLQNKEILCELDKKGIDIYLYDGDFRFMHAKYIIKNSEILITTENFGSSGFPVDCEGNRGWSAIVKDGIASEFAEIFETDLQDAVRFSCDIDDYEINYESMSCQPESDPVTYEIQEVSTIFAPDAVDEVLDLLEKAEKSIYIEQFYIYRYWNKNEKTPNLFLEAAIDKAREGKDVKILLDSYWYHLDEEDVNSNLNTAVYINSIAEAENLNLEARLADLDGIGVEKLHVKGVIVDERIVFVSSINWNENSPRNNREAGVVITGEAAEYFKDAFLFDWEGGQVEGKDDFTAFYVVFFVLIIFFLVVVFGLLKRVK